MNIILDLGEGYAADTPVIYTMSRKTRSGFAHDAWAIVCGDKVEASVHYCNRTWEAYRFQTAIHALCRKLAKGWYGRTKRAEAYAESLIAQADAKMAGKAA